MALESLITQPPLSFMQLGVRKFPQQPVAQVSRQRAHTVAAHHATHGHCPQQHRVHVKELLSQHPQGAGVWLLYACRPPGAQRYGSPIVHLRFILSIAPIPICASSFYLGRAQRLHSPVFSRVFLKHRDMHTFIRIALLVCISPANLCEMLRAIPDLTVWSPVSRNDVFDGVSFYLFSSPF